MADYIPINFKSAYDDDFTAWVVKEFRDAYNSLFDLEHGKLPTVNPAFYVEFALTGVDLADIQACPADDLTMHRHIGTIERFENRDRLVFIDGSRMSCICKETVEKIIDILPREFLWKFVTTAKLPGDTQDKEYPVHGTVAEPIVHPPVRKKVEPKDAPVVRKDSPVSPVDLPRVLYRNAAVLLGNFDYEKYLGLLRVSQPKLPSWEAIGDDMHTAMLPIINRFNAVQGSWSSVTVDDLRKFLTAVVLKACDELIASEPGTPGFTVSMPLVGQVHVKADGRISVWLIPYTVSYPEDE